jgi:membrane protease YdiL (CAAX protease family)
VFLVIAIPFRALTAWMYNRTGSLFLVGLLHAVGDATTNGSFAAGFLPRLYEQADGIEFCTCWRWRRSVSW